ncbi:MAG: hypothetical protein K6C97_01060 [Treponema sp.]|nr:hypothetical protein [Treponema sp.]
MLIFQIIVYVAFGFLCIYWIISGIKKLNNIRSEQEITAEEKESIIPPEKNEEKLTENQDEKSEDLSKSDL